MLSSRIPRETTWDLPCGDYKATIRQIKAQYRQNSRGQQEWVRFILEVQIPGLEKLQCMAGQNFKLDLNNGSELRNFLTGLLGRTYFAANSGELLDWNSLEGMECEVSLEHRYGDDEKHDKPLVVVTRLAPIGTLKLTSPPQPQSKPEENR